LTHSRWEGFASRVRVTSALSPPLTGYILLRVVPKWYLTSPDPAYLVSF